MITAVLTMDDGPTRLTIPLMEHLQKKHIRPVLFFVGDHVKDRFDDAVQAVKMSAIIGNHTIAHPFLDKIPLEQAIEEIDKQNRLIDQVYAEAGIEREVKLFRFPYGTHEGDNFLAIQKYLDENNYTRIDDRKCVQPWYEEQEFKKYKDVGITFSFDEWRTHNEENFRLPQIIEHIEEQNPQEGCPLLEDNSHHIIVLHDHEETDDIIPDYYKIILDYVMDRGVKFVEPTFVQP